MHLDRAIGQTEFEWEFKYEPKRGDTAWHPSGDCTPSLRQLYDKASGNIEPEQFDTGLRKTFMVGHFWHQYLQHVTAEVLGYAEPDHIERRGICMWGPWQDKPVPFHWATGAADIAPVTLPKYGEYLIDFKTMASGSWKQPHLPAMFAEKWEAQINVYMDWFNIDKALIVTICKDSPHTMKEFEYHRNPALSWAIHDKWKLVSQCLDEGICPPADEECPLPFTGPVNI